MEKPIFMIEALQQIEHDDSMMTELYLAENVRVDIPREGTETNFLRLAIGKRTNKGKKWASISFDLFPSRYDMKKEASEELQNEYIEYIKKIPHKAIIFSFARTYIAFDVLVEDAALWIAKVSNKFAESNLTDISSDIEELNRKITTT